MAASQKLLTDEEEVLAANRTFYTALHTLDISLMAQVWLHENWVKCLHPGWDLLLGWDEVHGSWEEIFRSTDQMMVSISRPLVHVAGDVAWVSCLENVTTASPKNFSSALVEATNIFQRRQGRWLLVHHHTTPLAQPPPDANAPVQ
ncbi:MAG TPA: nuclear transport factor 2 family protein [Terriglobia bacterium]|nr:nuclear transport factor 2 family protein [Terriglobia bacterium]